MQTDTLKIIEIGLPHWVESVYLYPGSRTAVNINTHGRIAPLNGKNKLSNGATFTTRRPIDLPERESVCLAISRAYGYGMRVRSVGFWIIAQIRAGEGWTSIWTKEQTRSFNKMMNLEHGQRWLYRDEEAQNFVIQHLRLKPMSPALSYPTGLVPKH